MHDIKKYNFDNKSNNIMKHCRSSITSEQKSYSRKVCYDTLLLENNYELRALMIDDNAVNRLVAKNLIQLLGVRVDEAANSAIAMDLILKNTYDIILMDYFMPDMNGLQLTKWIHNLEANKANAVVLGVSGNLNEELTTKFIEAGAYGVIKKPIDFEVMKKIIHDLFPYYDMVKTIQPMNDQVKEEIKYDTTKKNAVISNLISKIPEIDYIKGLHYAMGDALIYMKIIKVSVVNIGNCYSMINQNYLEKDNSEIKRKFHCIKSVLMHIGAETLAIEATALEEKVDLDNKEFQEQVEIFLKQLKHVLDALEHAIKAYNIIDSNDSKNEKSKLNMQLNNLEDKKETLKRAVLYHAKRFEYESMLEHLNVWHTYVNEKEEDQVKELILATERFDYERVITMIEEM